MAVDVNINRGVKHGFLDMNQPTPIPKDQLNAALSANPERDRPHAGAGRSRRGRIVPGPNGFRRMDVLTNEGRSWYQGIRFAVRAPHDAAGRDGVLHVLECRGSC